MKRFNRIVLSLVLIAGLLVPAVAIAADDDLQTGEPESISLSTKVPLKLYGFISAEAMWAGSQLSSFGANAAGNPDNTAYNRNMTGFNRVVDESTDGNNDAFISWTVQNTRFGFNLEPYDFNGKPFTVDARLEMDFFSTGNLSVHSVQPRIRRAYAGIGQERWRVLMGQEWDLFSPLNTATLNIGGNLWWQGNQGFRRPQLRFTFTQPFGEKSGVEAAASINLPSNSMAFNDRGNTTGIPMFQGRFGFWHALTAGKLRAYLSALYAKHKNANAGGPDINNWGVAASIAVPAHRFFKPEAEVQYGYSLGSVLSISSDLLRQRTISFWGQIKSSWLSWFETNIGYGMDDLNDAQVPAGTVDRNQVGFANVKFMPVKELVIGLEYNFLRTNYKGTRASNANAIMSNVVFFF